MFRCPLKLATNGYKLISWFISRRSQLFLAPTKTHNSCLDVGDSYVITKSPRKKKKEDRIYLIWKLSFINESFQIRAAYVELKCQEHFFMIFMWLSRSRMVLGHSIILKAVETPVPERVEICRDRHDWRSCKICARCVNFPGKRCDFLHNLRRTLRFTHTKCDFALQLLKFYTVS